VTAAHGDRAILNWVYSVIITACHLIKLYAFEKKEEKKLRLWRTSAGEE
jgi:hypothetical protein